MEEKYALLFIPKIKIDANQWLGIKKINKKKWHINGMLLKKLIKKLQINESNPFL